MSKDSKTTAPLIPPILSKGAAANKSGVLFDVDGVLVNTHHAHAKAWMQVLEPLGIELPAIRLYREEGRPSPEFFRTLLSEHNIVMSDEEILVILERKRAIYRTMAPVGMREDALFAVKELKRLGWRIGLVSGSNPQNVATALGEDGMSLFDAAVMAGSYRHGKPHPEPFLTGCKMLNVLPSQSVVIENAPMGITSGKAAGMRVIALTSTLAESDLAEADDIISDLRVLPELLGFAPV